MGLIEQLQYLIYDFEVYFCEQNFVMAESLFQCVEVNEKYGFHISFEKFNRISNRKRSLDIKF